MNFDFDRLWKALAPFGKLFKTLMGEHTLLTATCGLIAVLITISFYRFLRSVNPGLVGFILLLMLGILILHWTVTRTEPEFLRPAIDLLSEFFPSVQRPAPGGFAAPVVGPGREGSSGR